MKEELSGGPAEMDVYDFCIYLLGEVVDVVDVGEGEGVAAMGADDGGGT